MTTSEAIRAALSWLATYGLHSTLLLGGAWILCRLRPPRVNRNRERLWKLALVGGLVSASLQLGLGWRPPFGGLEWALGAPPPPARAELVQAVPAAVPSSVRAPVARDESAPRRRPGDALSSSSTVSAPPSVSARSSTPPLSARNPTHTPSRSAPRGGQDARARTEPSSAPEPSTDLASTASLARPSEPLSARAAPSSGPSALARTRALLAARWPGMLLAGWTVVGLVGLLGLGLSWTCLRRLMLGRTQLRTGPLVELLEELRLRAGMRRRVRLSLSERVRTPFSTGLLRPEVCLPKAVLTDLSRAQQRALLAHELAHLLRRDPAWFGLGFLLETLFFFQPLNRVARRELGELAEIACDDWAVRWTGARLALASCLTEVAGWVVGERERRVALPGLAGQRSRLGQRVERLLDDRRSPAGEPPTPWWPPFAAGVLGLVVLAGPGVSAGRAPLASGAPARPAPSASPVAAPRSAPRSVTRPAPMRLAPALEAERGVLEAELALLQGELESLRAELEARALAERFATTLARIDGRVAALRAQHREIQARLARLPNPSASPVAPSPDGASDGAPTLAPRATPDTDVQTGDPR